MVKECVGGKRAGVQGPFLIVFKNINNFIFMEQKEVK